MLKVSCGGSTPPPPTTYVMVSNHTKQVRKLAGFYLNVADLIRKDIQHRTTLDKIADKYDRNMAYSWMQWSDAKQWFTSGIGVDNTLEYYLKPHLLLVSLTELYHIIREYYNLNY